MHLRQGARLWSKLQLSRCLVSSRECSWCPTKGGRGASPFFEALPPQSSPARLESCQIPGFQESLRCTLSHRQRHLFQHAEEVQELRVLVVVAEPAGDLDAAPNHPLRSPALRGLHFGQSREEGKSVLSFARRRVFAVEKESLTFPAALPVSS